MTEPPGFQELVDEALAELPDDLRRAMSNVTVLVEDEPPDGAPLLGLYQGVPLTRRTSRYGGVLPDKISIYRGPLERSPAVIPSGCAGRFGGSCCTRSPTISGSATSGSSRSTGTRGEAEASPRDLEAALCNPAYARARLREGRPAA